MTAFQEQICGNCHKIIEQGLTCMYNINKQQYTHINCTNYDETAYGTIAGGYDCSNVKPEVVR
jgi:RNase P subunit RPR2